MLDAPAMTILPARFEHVPAIRSAWQSLAAEMQGNGALYPALQEGDADQFTLSLADAIERPDVLGWVALDGAGVLVGFLLLQVATRPIGQPAQFAFGEWMWVRGDCRKAGVGTQLFEAVVAELTRRGIDYIELSSVPGDAQWRDRGWVPYQVRYAIRTADLLPRLDAHRQPKAKEAVAPVAPTPQRRRGGRPRRATSSPLANGHDGVSS